MKKILNITISSLFLLVLCSFAYSYEIETTASTGFHLDWWDSPNNDTGLQYYVPLKVTASYDNISLGLLSGYCYTTHKLPQRKRRSISDILDTKLNLGYEITNKLPVDILLGLDLNLPTGRTNLKDEDVILIMDPDLVSITSLGEGFNVNPTISIAKEWNNWMFGLGLGYVFRGEYDFSKSLQDYNPGDIFSFTTQIHYFPTENWHFKLFTNFTTYGKDELKDKDFYDDGNYFQIGLGSKYSAERFDIQGVFQFIYRGKSKFFDYLKNGLQKEGDNSHGNEWIGQLRGNYYLDDKTSINSTLLLLLITSNDYEKGSIYYWGQRRKIRLDIGLTRQFNKHFSAKMALSGFFMHDDETWYHPFNEQSYRGFSVDLRFVGNF